MNETKKKSIEYFFTRIILIIGIDKPSNFDQILEFIINDVEEAADPENWTSEDVAIGFRRWIEAQEKEE